MLFCQSWVSRDIDVDGKQSEIVLNSYSANLGALGVKVRVRINLFDAIEVIDGVIVTCASCGSDHQQYHY
jgi:hypothetical protein